MSEKNKPRADRPAADLLPADSAERLAARIRLAHRAFNPNRKPDSSDTHRAG